MKKRFITGLFMILIFCIPLLLSSCNRTPTDVQFRNAAADVMEYFTAMNPERPQFPQISDPKSVSGTVSLSIDGLTEDTYELPLECYMDLETQSFLGKLTVPLSVLDPDSKLKIPVHLVSKNETFFLSFPDASDYVLTLSPEEDSEMIPLSPEIDLEKLWNDLSAAIQPYITSESVKAQTVDFAVDGGEPQKTTQITLTLETEKLTALQTELGRICSEAALPLDMDTAEDPVTQLSVSFYVQEEQTVCTKVTGTSASGETMTVTLTTTTEADVSSWAATWTTTEKNEEQTVTISGTHRIVSTGVEGMIRLQAFDPEKNSHTTAEIGYTEVIAKDSISYVFSGSLKETDATGVVFQIPIDLQYTITKDTVAGLFALDFTLGEGEFGIKTEFDLTLNATTDDSVAFPDPDDTHRIPLDEVQTESEKPKQFWMDLFEHYPELLAYFIGEEAPSDTEWALDQSFSLINIETAEAFFCNGGENGYATYQQVYSYTEENGVVTAQNTHGNGMTFTFDPQKDTQTVEIDGLPFAFETDGTVIQLTGPDEWIRISLDGKGIMVVEQAYNYVIRGNTLTLVSGLLTDPIECTFRMEEACCYINEIPFVYEALELL